ncbi:AAA family ATPase [Rapidithrix thailandica]|uniref:AAA family ATPase n=1 Tax=Rapidithrix thailandica TaxID=413964 RepID=A0AAW9S4Z8_9BACT
MAKAKKFGTFSGVFVPSVLTILGVIMYLRLGWVTGHAGLIGSIVIILIAHVISVTTGLSVSSVATDKKVKAGGLYYMLSRSLGLPMGGAIGITLYVATALSISMYVVGFSESFNDFLRGFMELGQTPEEKTQYIRITGSVTMLVITTLALISTSLALKTQFYILIAIGLSLVSIFGGGLFTNHSYYSGGIMMFPKEGVNMEDLFAIFFPAVTGFTAGVAMSGDLKDPKKSIPMGTMASITVGLIVYILLALFFTMKIDPTALQNDTNILSKITLFAAYGAPLLMAGIWGATLSSALGGILGGPRILQAMSIDKITPKQFAKGVGKDNEPRNALILTFIIAEIGILIGELDLIAPIVSMFYLAAYGFINLTCALESWASSDFRPQFKIPKFISIAGAIATFAVMFKLSTGAMIMSFVIIGGIFFYLTRRQISLGFSDIWQGVWSEIVRTGLFKISHKAGADKRNWRPNILLFSGGGQKRPYLIDFGRNLVGRLGLVSNIELIVNGQKHKTLSKVEAAEKWENGYQGVFSQKFYVENILDGIETISKAYGFPGLEPNTILMGWAHNAASPQKFAHLLNSFTEQDYNLLVMHYDHKVQFGKKSQIDIWYDGRGNNLTLALTMLRFLISTDEWINASLRILIHTSTSNVDSAKAYKMMASVLEELRLTAEIKTINSALDTRPLYEIVKSESGKADLIFMELPKIEPLKEEEFHRQTDELCQHIGTLVFYRASSEFEPIEIGLTQSQVSQPQPQFSEIASVRSEDLVEQFTLPEELKRPVQGLQRSLEHLVYRLNQQHIQPIVTYYDEFLQQFEALILSIKNQIDNPSQKGTEEDITSQLLHTTHQLLSEFQNQSLKEIEGSLAQGVEILLENSKEILDRTPETVKAQLDVQALKSRHDFHTLRQHIGPGKFRLKTLFKDQFMYIVKLQKVIDFYLNHTWQKAIHQWMGQFTADSQFYLFQVQKHLQNINEQLQHVSAGQTLEPAIRQHLLNNLEDHLKEIKLLIASNRQRKTNYREFLIRESDSLIRHLAGKCDQLSLQSTLKEKKRTQKEDKLAQQEIQAFPEAWSKNQELLFNFSLFEVKLYHIQHFIQNRIKSLKSDIDQAVEGNILVDLKKLKSNFTRISNKLNGQMEEVKIAYTPSVDAYHRELSEEFLNTIDVLTDDLPESLDVPENNTSIENNIVVFEEMDAMSISPKNVIHYTLQTHCTEPIVQVIDQLYSDIEKENNLVQDAVRMASFSLETAFSEKSGKDNSLRDIKKLLEEEKDRVSAIQQKIKEQKDQVYQEIQAVEKEFYDRLNPYSLVKSAVNIDYFLFSKSKSKAKKRFTSISNVVKEGVQNSITKLVYRRSEGVLAAKKLQNMGYSSTSYLENLIHLKEKVSPKKDVLQHLPFYYKQLFLKSHTSGKELWYGREKELQEINKAIGRYHQTRSGALLIVGEQGMGKTFLADYAAQQNFSKGKVFHIHPPFKGSASVRTFKNSVTRALKSHEGFDTAFERLNDNSVCVFHDIELWWDRSPDGYAVIDMIKHLIDQAGHKCCMIFTINPYAFRFINHLKNLEDSFLKIVTCEPFPAEALKNIILLRHQSSRMKFRLNGQLEKDLPVWKLAGLFSSIFDISGGNIGIALQTWVSNIEKIDGETLEIKSPTYPNIEVLRNMKPEWVIVLVQFILHKRLTTGRLQNILNIDLETLETQLVPMLRSGILVEDHQVLSIDPYIRPFLLNAFVENDIL